MLSCCPCGAGRSVCFHFFLVAKINTKLRDSFKSIYSCSKTLLLVQETEKRSFNTNTRRDRNKRALIPAFSSQGVCYIKTTIRGLHPPEVTSREPCLVRESLRVPLKHKFTVPGKNLYNINFKGDTAAQPLPPAHGKCPEGSWSLSSPEPLNSRPPPSPRARRPSPHTAPTPTLAPDKKAPARRWCPGSAHAWSPVAGSEGVSRQVWFSLRKHTLCVAPRFHRQTQAAQLSSAAGIAARLQARLSRAGRPGEGREGGGHAVPACRHAHGAGDAGTGQPGPPPQDPPGTGSQKAAARLELFPPEV